jgi:(p)ppGpp synthase/HD superfamily hydrolase
VDALALAGELHAGDRRAREPYVNHLLRVAIRIICYYHVDDADVIAAAVLHDSVEDHPDLLGGTPEAALATLAGRFGSRVADLVAAVTNPAWEPGRHPYEQYREHVAHSLDTDPWARVIKISDFTDNGVGLIHTTGPKLGRMARKYAPLVPVLRELLARPDTPLADDVKAHIAGQLDLAERRFAAILSED